LTIDGLGELLRVTVTEPLTVCTSEPEEGEWPASPPYEARSWWFPIVKAEVEILAEPPDTEKEPNVAEPSKKVTVPVELAGVIAAVKVTSWHTADGLAELVSVVVVPPGIGGFTVWMTVLDVAAP
jgi:hypothetical protein